MKLRDPNSHKGQNGKVMIIGGSQDFYGAPILCALGAEYSGVDLLFPFLPKIHFETAKTHSLNFILHPFQFDNLSVKDMKFILDFSQKIDAVVIGPGLGEKESTQKAVKTLLKELKVPTVIDADALIFSNSLPPNAVLTPNRAEFTELTGDEPTPENVQRWAGKMNAVICCKAPEDIVASKDELMVNKTGNALMTVGGSGDVLAGLIGGLMAQGMAPFEAASEAARLLGKAAEGLAKFQGSLRAIDLARGIPSAML